MMIFVENKTYIQATIRNHNQLDLIIHLLIWMRSDFDVILMKQIIKI